MNMKTKYHVFLALSLFAAMLFTSCAEELNVNERAESDEDLSGFTCFSTESVSRRTFQMDERQEIGQCRGRFHRR